MQVPPLIYCVTLDKWFNFSVFQNKLFKTINYRKATDLLRQRRGTGGVSYIHKIIGLDQEKL